jgi:nucleoside-diphosphate-sugar epimerase
MAKILMTGAAGFVGRALLAEAGDEHEWIALDLGFPGDWNPGTIVTESVSSDLSDMATLREVVARVRPDAVVHLAGWSGKGGTKENRNKLLAANVASTWNLLDAIVASGIPKPQFVLASTALVYGNQPGPFHETFETRPMDEYATTKWLAEELVRACARSGGVVPSVLRPAVLYGPGQGGPMFVPTLARALAKGDPFPMTGGAQKRDLVHVRDASRAILGLVRARAEGVFNVGTGTGISMLEIGQKMAHMSGRPDLLRPGEIPYRDNEVWDYAVDSTRLAEATGWAPAVALDDGLEETLKEKRKP